MAARSWRIHLGRLAGLALVIALLGLLSGHWLPVIALACGLYLAWLLFNSLRLHRWLQEASLELPESIGIWADIFSRINALQLENIREHERYEKVIAEFREMTDAFPDATLVMDQDGYITWFNDTARQMLELRIPEDLGRPVTNLLRDPDFAAWLAVADQLQSRFEMNSPLDANVRLSVSSVRYREGQRLLILRDISDLYNLERVRRDFVANVSHELRTPLTVLIGYLEMLKEQADDETAPALNRMEEQARQMQALLNDLLELSRLQSRPDDPVAQTVDVPALLTQLKEQAEELSQGRHRTSFDIDPQLFCLGTAQDLESAFRNLVSNAIQYTPNEGSIHVRWATSADGGAEFSVRDSGIGIPARDIPRLTERFYRVGSDRSKNSGGTGLGLSIVKHVLNAHEAHLEISSQLGEGSEFRCHFPASRVVRNAARDIPARAAGA